MGSRNLVLQGLRGLGEGFDELGEGLADKRKSDEAELVREAERLKKEKQGGFIDELSTISTDISKDTDLGREEISPRVQDIVGRAAKEDIDVAGVTGGIENIIKARESAETAEQRADRQKRIQTRADDRLTRQKTRDTVADTKSLRKEISSLPQFKAVNVSETSLTILRNALKNPNAINKTAAITAFAKSLDEGARVTDADFRNVERSRALLTRLEGQGVVIPSFLASFLQNLDPEEGGRITKAQIGQMVEQAESQLQGKLTRLISARTPILEQANELGLKQEQLIQKGEKSPQARLEALTKLIDARKAKSAAATPISTNLEDRPTQNTLRAIDDKQFDILQRDNAELFTQAITAANQRRASEGQPPLTEAEEDAQINLLLKKMGLQLVMPPGGN